MDLLRNNKDYDDGHKQGMKDAWEIAAKIYLEPDEGGFRCNEIEGMFGEDFNYRDIFKMDIMEVADKISHWKEKSYRVGDIVMDCDSNKGIVTCVYSGILSILWASGDVGEKVISTITKTGNHIDGVEELLNKISAS